MASPSLQSPATASDGPSGPSRYRTEATDQGPTAFQDGWLAINMSGFEALACKLARHLPGSGKKTARSCSQQGTPLTGERGVGHEAAFASRACGKLTEMVQMIDHTNVQVILFTDSRSSVPTDPTSSSQFVHVNLREETGLRFNFTVYDTLMLMISTNMSDGANSFEKPPSPPPRQWNTHFNSDMQFGPPPDDDPWMTVTVSSDTLNFIFENDPSWWDGNQQVRHTWQGDNEPLSCEHVELSVIDGSLRIYDWSSAPVSNGIRLFQSLFALAGFTGLPN